MALACHSLDDTIVLSQSEKEHFQHLQKLFDVCVKENLKLKLSKCTFVKTKINFLGYEASNGCITPDNHNVEVIKRLKQPTNVKKLLGSFKFIFKFFHEVFREIVISFGQK